MKVLEFMELLAKKPPGAEVVIEDLNGLQWEMEESLLRLDGDTVVVGTKDINES